MARGGSNRKSAAQAKLDGTYRADRHVDPVEIAPGRVEMPTFLEGPARDAWVRWIAPRVELGFYEPAEAPMLALWCTTLVRCFAADKATPFAGVYEAGDGCGETVFKKHPGVTALKDMLGEFRALSARLGLDPLSRLALADLGRDQGVRGPELPEGAPPAFKPKVVSDGGAA